MAQVTAFSGNKEQRLGDAGDDHDTRPGAVATTASATGQSIASLAQPSGKLQTVVGADEQVDTQPNKKRNKAKAFGLLLVVGLGSCIAWYPLSDHHAPFAGGASITADVTQISARVPGPVTQVLVSDNAHVTAGQPLFQIDSTTYRMDVEQARAQLAQVMNNVGSGFAAIPAASAKLQQAEVALDTADDDLDRARQLAFKGLLSPAKLSQAEAAQLSAQLNVDAEAAEVARLTLVAGASETDNPNVRAAQAALEKAEFALANTKVVAPADGYVTNLSLTEGQFVGAGTPALTFINPATQVVTADFRENQLINVKPGDHAIVTFEAAPGKRFDGTVESIAWGISSGRTSVNGLAQSSNDSRWFPPARKIPVRVQINEVESLPENIRLGSEAAVLIVPEDGIIPTIAQTLLTFSGFISSFN